MAIVPFYKKTYPDKHIQLKPGDSLPKAFKWAAKYKGRVYIKLLPGEHYVHPIDFSQNVWSSKDVTLDISSCRVGNALITNSTIRT